ncbi:MAG: hypothetical protein ABL908_11685 [Hyphomicrobium sp.]
MSKALARLVADLGCSGLGGERHLHGLLRLAASAGLLDQDLGKVPGPELRQALDGELRSCSYAAWLRNFD